MGALFGARSGLIFSVVAVSLQKKYAFTALASVMVSFVTAITQDGTVQQKVIVQGTAGVIQQDLKNSLTGMKNAIDKRNDLAVERRDNIERLTAELETCGNCAERQQLSDELQLWKRRDAVIHAAESIAIK